MFSFKSVTRAAITSVSPFFYNFEGKNFVMNKISQNLTIANVKPIHLLEIEFEKDSFL